MGNKHEASDEAEATLHEKVQDGYMGKHDSTDIEKIDSDTSSGPIDAALNRLLNRKFDTHVLPWLFLFWLFAFIDRSNIGNARIDGLAEDLNLQGQDFNIALAIFYVPYIVVDVPSNLVLKYFKAGYYLPALLTAWGIVGTCTGFVKSFGGLLSARFFLGLCEGGLLGGMVIYLAMFYERRAVMWRMGLFYCAAPLSGAFGGLLATGLAQIRTPGYNGWPFIFFVEGAITVLLGIVAVFFLPSTPGESKFLTPEQRDAALRRMHLDSSGTAQAQKIEDESFDWYWVRRGILNPNTILLSLIFMLIIIPIYSFSLFLPTIIKSLGYSRVVTQLFTVPPNMAGFLTVLLTCYASDATHRRGLYMLLGTALTLAGYIMLISTPHQLTQYGGTFLVAAGIFPCSPLVMGWLANNLAPHYARATGTGFQIMIANCGAFVATFTYIENDAPRYITGHAINIGSVAAAMVLIFILMMWQKAENRKRKSGGRDYLLQEEDEDRLGDRHPKFVYTI